MAQEQAEALGRAHVMEEGRVVMEGQTSELLTRPEIQRAYLGLEIG